MRIKNDNLSKTQFKMGSLFEKNIINKILEYPKPKHVYYNVCVDECNICKTICYNDGETYDFGWEYCEICGPICDECIKMRNILFEKCLCDGGQYDQCICMECAVKNLLYLHYIHQHALPAMCSIMAIQRILYVKKKGVIGNTRTIVTG
jgi:hypothetical protein